MKPKYIRSFWLQMLAVCLVSITKAQTRDDSITIAVAPKYDRVSKVHRVLFGEGYRKLYNLPVHMRILNLSTEHGGLSVIRQGGGMQTQSLRFEDSLGREWTLRSIDKFPERSLPQILQNTIARDIVRDQVAVMHPFGALTVPPMAEALNIPHVSPELVYVGDDARLSEFREVFKNRTYMFELATPEANRSTDNTTKIQGRLEEDNDRHVNQSLTLRARLLDMVLGDWDRHEDNWRWLPVKEGDQTIYQPVPRDRDKVYYKTSGIFPILLSYQWLKESAQPFGPKIRNIAHWNFNQRYFDRYFLHHLDWKDWLKEIRTVQETLSDSLIHASLKHMPDTAFELTCEELFRTIQIRRDSLSAMVYPYYLSLAKKVDIATSDKNEFIDVDYNNDGSVTVKANNRKKDYTKGKKLFERTFLPSETKEIRIYGLGGRDEFKVHGDGISKVKVRLIGGQDSTQYLATEKVQTKFYIYDDKDRALNNYPDSEFAKRRLSNDTAVYSYKRDAFKYDRTGVLTDFNYGVDRGLTLGVGYIIEKQGFRKEPFENQQRMMVNYSTGRRSFRLDYDGIWKKALGLHDLRVRMRSLGPNNQSNFFGLGNKTQFEERKSRGIHYYRSKYDVVDLDVLIERSLSERWQVYGGSSSQFYWSSEGRNDNNFLERYAEQHMQESIFGSYFFTGASVGLTYDSRDNQRSPLSGVYWQSSLDGYQQIGGAAKSLASYKSSFSFYHSFGGNTLTWANRIGIEGVVGNPMFFQYAQLGGEKNLRGFNSNRFHGETLLFNNTELRLKVLEFNSFILPGKVGIIGFHDVGRVWMENEKSTSWHNGYGGGIYFVPAELFVFQALLGKSNEALLPYLSIGVSF